MLLIDARAAAAGLAALLLLAAGCGDDGRGERPAPSPGTIAAGESAPAAAPEAEVVLVIEGMVCANCVALLEKALSACPGVTGVSIDLASGRGVIGGRGLDQAALIRAVEAKGYSAAPAPPDNG